MKVVLFCGGLGMRIREYPEPVPKPMISIGYRPILWHLMKYYAHHGHRDFILCLGYKADVIKRYFLNYDECVSNNFVLSSGGKDIKLLNSDIDDWNITFVDTGINSNIGQRLKAAEPYLDGESTFLANYSDGLTDLALPEYVDHFLESGKVGSFLSVRPPQSYHLVSVEGDVVSGVQPISGAGIWINGGFFAFRKEIFDYMEEGEELVEEPFRRLIEERQLITERFEGYWGCMDTFKDRQQLDDLYTRGAAPWEVWKSAGRTAGGLAGPGRNGAECRKVLLAHE
ncbi:glucose-1-phosphate cytidylyltransferase (plasmid) [Tundrisphaera lichenicola]|uniref:glucose-1-phosphate cytidylyltransferase n=1 Tax=Tundrisphaera lichenicola TaxID=2029860 RepID=UPI003EB70CF9